VVSSCDAAAAEQARRASAYRTGDFERTSITLPGHDQRGKLER